MKPFEVEPKRNIGDINNSSCDDEEEGAEYKVKQISNSEWCKCSAKAVNGRFIKKRLQQVFSYEIYKIFKNIFFFQNTSTLMAASGSEQCKPMKRYTESLSC